MQLFHTKAPRRIVPKPGRLTVTSVSVKVPLSAALMVAAFSRFLTAIRQVQTGSQCRFPRIWSAYGAEAQARRILHRYLRD